MQGKSIIVFILGLVISAPTLLANNNWVDQILKRPTNLEKGRKIYQQHCLRCHGATVYGNKNGQVPQMAGQHQTVLVKQLFDIRSLNRDNPSMYYYARPQAIGGDQAVADVTAYIEALPANPNVGIGPGNSLTRGKTLFNQYCAGCHGFQGEGDDFGRIPKINEQHFEYMRRQFQMMAMGHRRNITPEKVTQIRVIHPSDLDKILDYLSRIRPISRDETPSNDVNL